MKAQILTPFVLSALAIAPLTSVSGQDADTAKLLKQLEGIEKSTQDTRSAAAAKIAQEVEAGAKSGPKAVSLMLEALRSLEYKDKEKSADEWKQAEDRIKSKVTPGFTALAQLYMRYLYLTLEAAQAKTDDQKKTVYGKLNDWLGDLGRLSKDAAELAATEGGTATSGEARDEERDPGKQKLAQSSANLRQPLAESVFDGPVPRFLKMDQTARPAFPWASVPGDVNEIYDTVILPLVRQTKDLTKIQEAWVKRMALQEQIVSSAGLQHITARFRETTRPELQWGLARDLYEAGRKDMIQQMMRLIQDNPTHKSAPSWIGEVKEFLQPTKPTSPATSAPEKSGGQ